ncbi:MAG: class I SAM-dependent methyltransferase [Serratia proteamaculans]|jgi:SAM-dependent methyltransferase|uniref:Class I SAM-dependent methyltransferase n=1 Tax=Serratia proteamaculans TaxID=28151 RepID=A0A7U0N8K8_SERPR|nr:MULTISPECIES: class I SAM-dependent methyltransferase [Serratia]SPZ52911.1 Methyltransferase domain [Serratia quinivorans]HCV66945.1 class I SAM-dependent methyltransferase [Serratia sp. (in: enterobacteria)]MBO1501516.1 class I SAM-dependent methyltransferase [Serratia proteamaculans]MDW5509403.1 class I SAM-dependent methyltransferase [Serratia proteamaculans]NWA70312.1 class I SAM-dependent methyltransferase [Serratia proteamaculans]
MKPAHTLQKLTGPQSWAELPWGEYYREALERQLQPWWSKLFGFHLLKLGNLSACLATDKCAISHQVNVGLEGDNLQVIGDAYQLPFAAKSVDACLLAHTLSYADDPHRMLREVDRVLIDDGWLVISTFNPFSLLGLGKLVPGLRQRQPYVSRMFTQMRLLDWLSLLNYEVLHQSRFHVLPWQRKGGKFLCTHLPALGCMSVIVARKRTLPLTPTPMKFGARKPALSRAVGATKSYRKLP